MKYRRGFISNSSTSSFICSVCGEIGSESDCTFSLEEWGLMECMSCGHVFHSKCVQEFFDMMEVSSEELERDKYDIECSYDDDDFEDECYYLLANIQVKDAVYMSKCPFCTLQFVSPQKISEYLQKSGKLGEILEEIRDRCGDINGLRKYIKNKE